MRNFIIMIGLCFFLTMVLAAAPVRVALLGDPELVDPVTAELSRHNDIELLERNEIEKIVAEHRLHDTGFSAEKLAVHFPHTDIFAVFTKDRLVIFNAKNGFRLWDGIPEKPTDHIRFAIAKRERKNPVYLSIVSVRNIGIPRTLEPQIETLIISLERKLIRTPEIQLLERERLGKVTDERALTGKQFALLPSTWLLTFELEPGRDNAGINVRILIRNIGGKILGECMEKDAFRNLPATVLSLQKQLHSFLFRQARRTADSKTEAARYFEEFTALRKSKYNKTPECTAKLEAALALDPNHPRYRYEEIRYRADIIRDLPYSKRVAEWTAQWERCRKFREQFPGWRSAGIMDTHCVLPGLNRRITRPGTDSYALAEEILAKMRRGAEQEERNFYRIPVSPESISNLRDLRFLGRIYSRKCRPEYFVSLPRCLEEQLQSEYEFFRYVEKYFAKYPEQQKKIEDILNRDGHWNTIDMGKVWGHDFPGREKAVTDHLNSPMVTEYLDFLARCRLPYLKRIRIILENMRRMVNGPRNKEHYRAGLYVLFTELEREFPQELVPSTHPRNWGAGYMYDWYLRNFCLVMLDDFRFYHAEKLRFQQKYKNDSDWSGLEETILHGSVKELAKQIKIMHKYNYERITKNRIGNLFGALASRLFDQEGKFQNSIAQKLFYDANAGFYIQTERYEDHWGGILSARRIDALLGAARCGPNTWLLLRSVPKKFGIPGQPPKLTLACLGDDGTVSSLIDTPFPAVSFEGKDDLVARRPAPIACNSRYIVIGDRDRNIHVYDLEQQGWHQIPDAAPSVITALVIASGRIWGLNGGSRWKKDFCMMFSCAMDGSDRQIHFSTARSKPQNELDGMKIREIDSLIISGENLLFTVTTEHRMSIFSFSMKTGEFLRLIDFPFTGAGIDHLWRQKDRIYCFTMAHGERIYRIDPAGKSAEWIFNQTGNRYKFDPPEAQPVVLKNGSWQMNYPWAFHGKMLYGAYTTPGAIRLDDVAKSPLLLLPGCAYVFETEDGVLYLGRYRYFFIREKNTRH